jgi:NAD(P)-dependent dehydrogenase (short-subunit alcohol dehydrogenase family)
LCDGEAAKRIGTLTAGEALWSSFRNRSTGGQPEPIAAAVVWLCSEGALFAVGQAMVVDGGQLANIG